MSSPRYSPKRVALLSTKSKKTSPASDIKIAADGVVTDAIKGATKVGEGSRNILEGLDEVVNPEDLDDVQKRNRWTLAAIVGVGAVAYFKLR